MLSTKEDIRIDTDISNSSFLRPLTGLYTVECSLYAVELEGSPLCRRANVEKVRVLLESILESAWAVIIHKEFRA